MKCMSCNTETGGTNLKRFNHIFLCNSCYEMAEKAAREIESTISRARTLANNWLETHIVQGGLLRGGNGHGIRAAAASGVSLPASSLPGVRDQEENRGARLPASGGKHTQR